MLPTECKLVAQPQPLAKSTGLAAVLDGASLEALEWPRPLQPVLVLINTKSGNRGGDVLYRFFSELLNPLQVGCAGWSR